MLKVITGRAFTSDGINPWPRFSDQRPNPQTGTRPSALRSPHLCHSCWGHGSTFHTFICLFHFPSQCDKLQVTVTSSYLSWRVHTTPRTCMVVTSSLESAEMQAFTTPPHPRPSDLGAALLQPHGVTPETLRSWSVRLGPEVQSHHARYLISCVPSVEHRDSSHRMKRFLSGARKAILTDCQGQNRGC